MLLYASPRSLHVPTVFISYSSIDHELVEEFRKMLATELEDAGYVIFMDDRSINGGDAWEKELYDNLKRSVVLLACLSPDYYASKWCTVERNRALDAGTKIIPVLLREVGKNHRLSHLQTRSNHGKPIAACKDQAALDVANRVVAEGIAEDLKKVPPSLHASRAAWVALAKVLGCTDDEAEEHLVNEGDGVCDWLDKQRSNLPDEPGRLRVAFDVALGLCEGWDNELFQRAVSAALKRELGIAREYWNAIVEGLVTMAGRCTENPADAFTALATELVQRFGADGTLHRLEKYAAAVPTGAKFAPVLLDLWVTENKVRRMELRVGSSPPANINFKSAAVGACIEHGRREVKRTLGPIASSARPRILRIITTASNALRPIAGKKPHTWESAWGERILDLFDGVVVWPITDDLVAEGAHTPDEIATSPCCVVEERGDVRAVFKARAGRPTTAFVSHSWDRGLSESPVAQSHTGTALSILLPDKTREGVRKRLFPEDENLPLPTLFERVAEWQRNDEEVHLLWTDADLAPEEDFAPMEQE